MTYSERGNTPFVLKVKEAFSIEVSLCLYNPLVKFSLLLVAGVRSVARIPVEMTRETRNLVLSVR